jgi:hypothetical protein
VALGAAVAVGTGVVICPGVVIWAAVLLAHDALPVAGNVIPRGLLQPNSPEDGAGKMKVGRRAVDDAMTGDFPAAG